MKNLASSVCMIAVLLIVFITPAFAAGPGEGGYSPEMKAKTGEMKDVVPKITAQELKAKMDRGEDILVIDSRTGNEYEGSKIKMKGAVRISIVNIEERSKDLPKDKEIVIYCT